MPSPQLVANRTNFVFECVNTLLPNPLHLKIQTTQVQISDQSNHLSMAVALLPIIGSYL